MKAKKKPAKKRPKATAKRARAAKKTSTKKAVKPQAKKAKKSSGGLAKKGTKKAVAKPKKTVRPVAKKAASKPMTKTKSKKAPSKAKKQTTAKQATTPSIGMASTVASTVGAARESTALENKRTLIKDREADTLGVHDEMIYDEPEDIVSNPPDDETGDDTDRDQDDY